MIQAKERASKNGFSKPLEVTEALRQFLGLAAEEKISRSDVTKRVSAYVKENNLKHPESGRIIVLDDKLKALLGPPEGSEITFLNIQKYLSPHYIKSPTDAATITGTTKKATAAPTPPPPAAVDVPSHPAEPPAKRPVVKRKAPAP